MIALFLVLHWAVFSHLPYHMPPQHGTPTHITRGVF